MVNPKIAHNMAQETRYMREVSEGIHPRLAVKVAPYLPIKELKFQGSEQFPVVIKAGDLVALDQWNQLTVANGGLTHNFTYGANDVTWSTPRYNGAVAFGKGATATNGLVVASAPNNCIGYAYTDYVCATLADLYLNYELQQPNKTVSTDWLVQYPIINAAQAAAVQGCKVMASNAVPGTWRPVVAGDYFDAATTLITEHNIIGKLYKIEKITDYLLKSDVIQGAPGLGLYGTIDSPIAGVDNHLLTAAELNRADIDGPTTETARYCATILIRI